jgi:integrase
MRVEMRYVMEVPGKGWRIYRVVPPELRPMMGGRNCFTQWLKARCQTAAEDEALPYLNKIKAIFDAAKDRQQATPKLDRFETLMVHLFGDTPEHDVSPLPMPKEPGTEPVSFDMLVNNWVAERKSTGSLAVSSIKGTRLAFGMLAKFLKHDNPRAVTPEDMTGFKLSLKGASSSNLKHLRLIKAVFNVADEHNVIRPNPCRELKLPTNPGKKSKKARFNVAELQKIVAGLEGETDRPATRWLITLALYSGARLQDFADARTTDFRRVNGMVALRVRDGKTDASEREFPLHPAIIDAGFVEYLDSLPEGPLFPMVEEREIRDEQTGETKMSRSQNAGARVNKFLERVGVYVVRQKTFHCLRHTYKTVNRHFVPREDVSDYLTGSDNDNAIGKSESRKYGDYPLGILKPAVDGIPSNVSEWWFLA